MASVGENVKRLRAELGHRHQGKFAKKAGVSQQWLSDLENGRYEMPDTASLMKLSAALPCTLDELVRGVDPGYDKAVRRAREEWAALNAKPSDVVPSRNIVSDPLEVEHLHRWRELPENARRSVSETIDLFLEMAAAKKRKSA